MKTKVKVVVVALIVVFWTFEVHFIYFFPKPFLLFFFFCFLPVGASFLCLFDCVAGLPTTSGVGNKKSSTFGGRPTYAVAIAPPSPWAMGPWSTAVIKIVRRPK